MMSVQRGWHLKKEKRRNNYNKNSSGFWSNQKSKRKEKKRKGKEKGNKFKWFLSMMSMQGIYILKKKKRRDIYNKNSVS